MNSKELKQGELRTYVRIQEKNKTDRGISCPDCGKIRKETMWRGDPPLCEKHRAESIVERLGGKITWGVV
jgi:hypothetical protein